MQQPNEKKKITAKVIGTGDLNGQFKPLPKKYVTKKEAETKRDSLDNEAKLKKAAALQAKEYKNSKELMDRASKDYDMARKWDENIKKSKPKK